MAPTDQEQEQLTGNGNGGGSAPSDPPKETPAAKPQRAESRAYVVLEDGGEDGIIVHDAVDAPGPDEACWELVERPGSALNKRAIEAGEGKGNAPKLTGVLASRLRFEPYTLESVVETRRKRG